MFHSLVLFLVLFGTWTILSGRFDSFFLISGAVSSFIAVAFAWRMDVVEKEKFRRPLYLNWRTPFYCLWLIKEIIVSSVNVAKIMWQVKPKISPAIAPVSITQTNDVGRTLLANSITLTPGTVSIIVEPNRILVHALEKASIKDLKQGEMDRKVVVTTSAQGGK